jgi:hypothetical protein
MNKFKMVPEVVLLLSNTDYHEQVQDYPRGYGGQCLVKVEKPLPYSRSCSWQSEFGSSKIISGIILNLFMVAGN